MMPRTALRIRSLCAALLVPLAAGRIAAQTSTPVRSLRSPGFGGGGVFVSPFAAASLGRFRILGDLEITWGEASARQAAAFIATDLPAAFRLTGGVNATSASAQWERRSDQSLGLTLERGRAALTLARRRSHAAFAEYDSEINGFDARLGIALGTPLDLGLGLTSRTSAVVQRGNLRPERRIIVAGYEFISVRRLEFINASRHRDVELELSAAFAGFRLSGFFGRGFSDGAAPDRSWAYGRLARPLARRLEIMAEAGRNDGVPAIGRMPQGFARLGLRVNLAATHQPSPRALPLNDDNPAVACIEHAKDQPRLVVTANAAVIEMKGNLTAWQAVPMHRLEDGRWFIPVNEGILYFNIRIDGQNWTTPSGVPVIRDEFSGAPVAVLVVMRYSHGRDPQVGSPQSCFPVDFA